jgi:hypothetical protein
MKKLLLTLVLAYFLSIPLYAQQNAAFNQNQPKKKKTAEPTKVYYGGIVGMSFGNYFRINVSPFVGYKFIPNASVGVKVSYEYINDSRNNTSLKYHNFGGSVFTRYRFIPQAYAHAEFAYMSYQWHTTNYTAARYWVPFLLLGGGYIQRVSSSASLVFEVLFDVLQDSNSPYEDWSPFISIGVNVGF